MIKRLLILFCSLALIVSTIGCGSNNNSDPQVNPNDFNFDFGSSQDAASLGNSTDVDADLKNSSSTKDKSSNKNSSKTSSNSSKNKDSSKSNSSSAVTSTQNNGSLIDDIYSSTTSHTSSTNTSSVASCNHSYIKADCEQPEECKLCGDIKSKALGHKFENKVCSVCGATALEWYSSDISITKEEVDKILSMQYTKPKNVIMMIGDGMGPNDIAYTEENFNNCYDFGLVLNQIKNTGWATTRSASDAVTDSAASGTALATGVKTSNGSVGVSVTEEKLTNISEIAREKGKKVGIVTNDDVVGATPSAFAVHISSRGLQEHIAKKFVDFAPDVLIGQGVSNFTGLNLNKFVLAKEFSKFNDALNSNIKCNRPFLGFFNENTTSSSTSLDTLAYCSEMALNRLSKNSPNGFFLMIENTTCDNAGHDANINNKMRGVVMLDRAVAKVLKFMKNNPDTLLIITSDHDNGNITMDGKFPNGGGHTGINVRTFAVGYGAEYFNGTTVDNTDIAKFAINAVKNS